MNTTPLYIFDLDGTLADLKHRRHHVERPPQCKCDGPAKYTCLDCTVQGKGRWKPNWDAFHTECVNDTPIAPVISLLVSLYFTNAEVWIWSGRMETVRKQTIDWLDEYVIALEEHVSLQMRPAGDYTPDDQLKESWLHAMSPEDHARLVMVFDDRDRVVEMWRRNGIVCAQVAPGDF